MFILFVVISLTWPLRAAESEPAPASPPKAQCKAGDWVEFEVRLAEDMTATGRETPSESSGNPIISMRFRLTVLRVDKATMDLLLKTRCGSDTRSIVRRNLRIATIAKLISANRTTGPGSFKRGKFKRVVKIKLQIGKRQYTGIEQTWQTTTVTGKLTITRRLCRAIPFGLAGIETGNRSLQVVAFGNRNGQKKAPPFPHPDQPARKITPKSMPQSGQ